MSILCNTEIVIPVSHLNVIDNSNNKRVYYMEYQVKETNEKLMQPRL